jgi:molybdopterin/thiamine biosynthesis adenylyltransferase
MFLTVPDTVLRSVLQQREGKDTGALYGRLIDGGDVVQVGGLDESAGTYLGRWAFSDHLALTEPIAQSITSDGEMLLLISDQPHLHISVYRYEAQQLHPIPSDVIRLHADYGARLRGLFEVDQLADRCVAVIGLGTGGAMVATQLARCGIGRMRLVDFDRLEVRNIARHVCSLRDIGRYKTRAVRDLLLDISPVIQVETYEADVLAQPDVLEKVVDGCDLVVAATDSEQSKIAINQACWPRGIPAVYGAAYNRAFGGDIFRVIPPDGACYNCFQTVVIEFFGAPPAAATDFSPGYTDPSRMADLIAEPGLGLDVGVIALLMAQMALLTLLRNTTTTLPDLPTNWLLFGNRAEWIFQKPLESLFIDVPKRPDCPVCNYETYVRQNLGMTTQEADAVAKQIVSEAPEVTLPIDRQE